MNINYIKYAVVIAKCGSIGKAADTLATAQPNLSRAMKDLENDLGIKIFQRTPSGVVPTPDGEEFLQRAQKILDRIDELENKYKKGDEKVRSLSVCAPGASYILASVNSVSEKNTAGRSEIFYYESNTDGTIKSAALSRCGLGIVRVAAEKFRQYEGVFAEHRLSYEILSEYELMVTISRNSPLASYPCVCMNDLECYKEIVLTERSRPMKLYPNDKAFAGNQVYAYERTSRPILLTEIPNTYIFLEPLTQELLDIYRLIQLKCSDSKQKYMDILIYRNDHRLTVLEKMFIDELRRSCISNTNKSEDQV